jgi:hypothetical protein
MQVRDFEDRYAIPTRIDQCEHCGNIFYTPQFARFCVVYTEPDGTVRHDHICDIHAQQVRRCRVVTYEAAIPDLAPRLAGVSP